MYAMRFETIYKSLMTFLVISLFIPIIFCIFATEIIYYSNED
jgi:hypothetical protein